MSNPLVNFPFKVILASKSPRRQKLLKGLDIPFEVNVKAINETFPKSLKEHEIPLHICKLKAAAFEKSIAVNELIITADTIVWFEGKELEKPQSRSHAVEMLQKLSDNMHTVYTALCLKTFNSEKTFHDATNVFFKPLKSSEIDYYLDTYEPYDKAGSYGIQEWLGYTCISKIEGCFFNVMGLPMPKLYNELLRLKA